MTGTWKLIRLILRRDRVLLPLWAVLIGLIPSGYASSFKGIFATDQDRIAYANTSRTEAFFTALYGPLHGSSLGELSAWRAGFIPVIVGLFALLTVVRHTRTDEESGRTELLGAAAIGRYAQLAAAVITTGMASVVLGLVLTGSMSGQGVGAAGSLAFGVEFMLAGWVFAGVGAVTAQLSGSARTARVLGIVVLAAAFALRAGGDVSSTSGGRLGWLSWLSPLGWVIHIFPYASNAALPMLLAALFTAAIVALAAALRARRDLGDGLLPARLGPATAGGVLRTPIGLAWNLHRGLLAGWTAGFALLGLLFGGVGGSIDALVADNKSMTEVFARLGGTGALVNAYFASTAGIVGLIAACYAVQATLRLRDEEQTGHAEAVLATAVSRTGWAASHLVFALLGPALALFAEGLLAGLVYDPAKLGGILGGAMLELPAVWVLAALTILLFGRLPRWSLAAWAGPAGCLLVLLVGETLQLNHWLLDISPFTHTPRLPGGPVPATPIVTLLLVALALTTAGLTTLRNRNLPD